jgi:hypothetical protein
VCCFVLGCDFNTVVNMINFYSLEIIESPVRSRDPWSPSGHLDLFFFPLSQSTCCTAIAACVSQGDSPFSCKIWTLQFVDLFVVQPVDVNLALRKNFNNSNCMATMTNLHICGTIYFQQLGDFELLMLLCFVWSCSWDIILFCEEFSPS